MTSCSKRCVVISPHFDDAVLSLGGWLRHCDIAVDVVTLCGGEPGREQPPSSWDLRCGFGSGQTAARERAEEDARACALLGAGIVHLPFSDLPYSGPKDREKVKRALEPHVARASQVWAPLGIGGHLDHVVCRDAALMLAGERGMEISLYADLPYAAARGWDTDDSVRDARFRWEDALCAVRSQATVVSPIESRRLDVEAQRHKLAATRCYASQLASLAHYYPRLNCVDGELGIEGQLRCLPAQPRGRA